MNVRSHIKVDKAAFFRFIASQAEGRYEYDRGHIVQQMTGGTLAHSLISQRFISAFERRLDGIAWAVTGHSRGVETPATVRYPDVLVEPIPATLKGLATDVPTIVVEVLSPTTEEMDLNVKVAEYGGLTSLKAYIVASQDQACCWIWLRTDDGLFPELPGEVAGIGRLIDIPALSLSIPLEEIYRGIAHNR